ncbi:MAG: UDP-3-O-(3-hydroxymyristoyl)glucosamine N-acyltransferase, partial [Planctomycetaceae bacterium]|nr:UDP-3-O-(3-hydroxymyristoyl)glucosamine N-acyltransferase [Planctomycetaceae bacterium]
CDIHAGVVIGDGCQIGDHVTIHANTVIYHDSIIGNNVTIHATCVIGADGFGYRLVDGGHQRLPHYGIVRICDDVEIGAGTTIDRAKIGETLINSGTRIDNQVMIGHNCQIGRHNILISQVGFAGSVSTGDYVVCAGQAGIADHVHLGTGAIIGAKAGVHRDMPGGQAYLGTPAAPAAETGRQLMALRRLPEMRSTLKQLEKEIEILRRSIRELQSQQDPGSNHEQMRAA